MYDSFDFSRVKYFFILPARETSNMYRISKEEYSNVLQNAVTIKYNDTDKHTATDISKEGVRHTKETNINRIEKKIAQIKVSSH